MILVELILVSAVTIGNIHESQRFKNFAWRLLGILPVLKSDKGAYSEESFTKRNCRLFQDALRLFFQDFDKYHEDGVKMTIDGKEHLIKIVMGMAQGDLPEQHRATGTIQVSCMYLM